MAQVDYTRSLWRNAVEAEAQGRKGTVDLKMRKKSGSYYF
jgi:hypothetical protein